MPAYNNYTDKQLLRSLQAGSEEAFVALYTSYSSLISSYIKKFVKSSALADDLSQEVFLKVWESRTRLAEIRALRPWVFTLARNHTLNFLKRATIDNAAKAEILRHYPQSHQNTEDALLTADYLQYIRGILSGLPPRTREVFRLCREQEKTYEETAAELGISRNAVKKHMMRSMKALRGSVEKDLGISLGVLMILAYCT